MASHGIEERSHVLGLTTLTSSPDLSTRLDLEAGAPVRQIERVRTAGGEPLVLETTYLPLDLAAGFDWHVFERGSIYDWIERAHRRRVTHANEIIRPTIVSRVQARHLRVPTGAAAFRVERTTWAGSRAIEWQEEHRPRRPLSLHRRG